MKKKILALTLSVAMLTTGALTSVPAAEFEDTSICATEVSSDAIEDFDSLDTREDTEVEFDNTDSNFSSEENIDYSYEGIDSSDSEFISDETEVFTEDVGIDDDINPENSSVSETPSREPLKPAVTESIVTGLEKPLKFYPGKFYDFTVTGAGMDNTDPIENDERWEPLYWSTKIILQLFKLTLDGESAHQKALWNPIHILCIFSLKNSFLIVNMDGNTQRIFNLYGLLLSLILLQHQN